MASAGGADIAGIGVDFTSCTVLPAHGDGTPLALDPAFRHRPHAWPMLWKHHASQRFADRFNASGWDGLRWYGGKTSSEWLWAKAWQVLDEAPDVFAAAERFVEGGDWIIWQLAGREVRSACQAGYKAHWQPGEGYPSRAFLGGVQPRLGSVLDRLGAPQPLGAAAGGLTRAWADRTGLRPGTPIAVAVIDAHAAVPALGVADPGRLVAIIGTSSCHMMLGDDRAVIPGISGVVRDGILPGFFGYEAGQVAVGDMFEWYVRTYTAQGSLSEPEVFARLEAAAASLAPGKSGLLALDWWNGCRTPLVDADLSGVIIGFTLATQPGAVYRSLIEASAFGTRLVLDTFEGGGIPVREMHACGGVATKSPLLLQIYADVIARPVMAYDVPHASAVGAAVYGAVAGGAHPDLITATRAMGARPVRRYEPVGAHREVYDALYAAYRDLHASFSRPDGIVKRLRRVQQSS
jgi:L-ribulokinase